MVDLAEAVAALLIVLGAVFLFVGSLGLATLPDMMRRLHAPTKATTLGIGFTLIASMIWSAGVADRPTFHEVLITLFLFLTAPVTAQMIAKAHILRSRQTQAELPDTGCPARWATLPREIGPGQTLAPPQAPQPRPGAAPPG
jgi:multicomponent K+:H+ antiporter subunit G